MSFPLDTVSLQPEDWADSERERRTLTQNPENLSLHCKQSGVGNPAQSLAAPGEIRELFRTDEMVSQQGSMGSFHVK